MAKTTSLAKITRPRLPETLPRTRLFRLLDRERKEGSVVWVSGPAGSGKTTLVANYLNARNLSCLWYQADAGDKDIATFFYYMSLAAQKAAPRTRKPLPLLTLEYLQDVPTFSKRYFENICSRLQLPFIMVVDNYQEIPSESLFHKIFQVGVSSMPEGVSVVIISRAEPPPGYATAFATNRMRMLGWEDLRLSSDEAKQIIRIKARRRLPDGTVRSIIEKTQGWAAGIVLMAEQSHAAGGHEEVAGSFTPERIFHYFTSELFDRADEQVQHLLLKTSLLPKFTVSLAEALTGRGGASEILADLTKRYFFTVSRPGSITTYEYHPLFREYLLSRARQSHTPSQFQALQRTAAALLYQDGQIEDAALLFMQGQGWEELAALARSHAHQFISQGRSHTVEEWLNSLPASFRAEDPWLNYWQGICKITIDLQNSRNLLERAFELSKMQKDTAGLYLSWCGIVDSFVYEWGGFMPLDRWITEIEDILKKYPAFPSPEIEARVSYGVFCALMYRQPHHRDIDRWAERAMATVLTSNDVQLKAFISSNLIMYYSWWRGDMARSSVLVDALQERVRSKDISPLLSIIWNASAAADALLNADNARCLSLAESGLKLAEDTGMHIWNFMLFTTCTWATLTMGDIETADRYLRKMSVAMHTGHKGNLFVYHWQMGWKFLCEERFSVALNHQLEGLKVVREGGFTMGCATLLQGAAEALIELGDFSRAKTYLDEAYTIGLSAKSLTFEYQNSWLTALYHLRRGERSKGLSSLGHLLKISRENGIYSHVQWRTKVMTELFTLALEEGVEVEHVQKVIRLHAMAPTEAQLHLDNWPWPVRVYTLGRFVLEHDGKPVMFGAKTPKKPLELLKAVIALGGGDVSEEKIIDALWPEAPGDLAYKSFEMALQRLRKLLCSDKAVRRQEGKLTLDNRFCWTDIAAFEQMADAEQELQNADRKQRGHRKNAAEVEQLEKAIALYKGHLLPTDTREPWLALPRERLRSKFLRLVTKAGEQYEQAGEWKKAIDCFERGLERDPACEEFYQHLMRCHAKLGHRSEAVKVYERCHTALRHSLGLEPSARTQLILASIR